MTTIGFSQHSISSFDDGEPLKRTAIISHRWASNSVFEYSYSKGAVEHRKCKTELEGHVPDFGILVLRNGFYFSEFLP